MSSVWNCPSRAASRASGWDIGGRLLRGAFGPGRAHSSAVRQLLATTAADATKIEPPRAPLPKVHAAGGRGERSMCGIVGFLDRHGRRDDPTRRVGLAMLEARGCRGPDSAGVALIREAEAHGAWTVRIAPGDALSL